METEIQTGLPASVKLPFEAQNHNITPYFKHLSVLNVAQSEMKGKAVYDLKEVVELRFAGDRNYSPVFPVDAMSKKVGTRVITFAERWADQYLAFTSGDDQKSHGTALEMLDAYGITASQLSLCRAVKIYSIEALHNLDGPNLKTLGMNANALKSMARQYMEDRDRKKADAASKDDVSALKAEIERLSALLPRQEASPEEIDEAIAVADAEFEAMDNDQIKEFIAAKVGTKPRGNPSRETLVSMAREAAAA